jgi:glycosyltransferase involved in cell wall biosynthesis
VAKIAVVSYRLGGGDGVAIEAAKWIDALVGLGHEVLSVAGEGRADVLVDGLGLADTHGPDPTDLAVLGDVDLTIVENVASLPLNPEARTVLYQVLADRRAIFRHHDLAWQRPHLAHFEAPRDAPTWSHVTINDLSRVELAQRGLLATTLYNSFDCDPPLGRRAETRRRLGVDTERLALLPTRALPRKNVAGALALCEALDATLWLLGPAEDGYEDTLEQLLASTRVPVIRRGLGDLTIHDAYGAADLVVVSSTWEGFGNPVLESVTHRRPLALYPYPVAAEIRAKGLTFFELGDVATLSNFLDAPDESLYEANLALAREHFNLADLPGRLRSLLSAHGLAT